MDQEPYFSSNEFTAFGTAIHEALEKFNTLGEEELYKLFESSFLSQLKEIEEQQNITVNKEVTSQFLSQAKPILDQAPSVVKDYFGEYEIVSVEEELMESISEFESYGKKFKGFIDLVIKTGDEYHIIDWKTCSWGWRSAKKTDPLTNYQLTFYKNYFAKKHNLDTSKVHTYFILLKRTSKKENVEIVKVTSGPKKTKNSLKLLENAVINIEKKFHPKNRLSCKYCKFHNTEKCK